MTSRKDIKIFDFNGVNVAKHWPVQGRIQDFLIGGEPNNLGYRGRGTNERSELRAKRVTSEASINHKSAVCKPPEIFF